MKIAVDIDGVIADFVGSFLPRLNKYRKCTFNDVVNYNFAKNIKISTDKIKKLWKECEEDMIYSELKLIKGCDRALDKLARNHEIILVTSRRRTLKKYTSGWLKKHKIPFAKLKLADSINEKVKIMSKCSIVIEDSLEIARMLGAKGIPVLLFDYPWNRISKKIKRVKNWNDVLKKITKIRPS